VRPITPRKEKALAALLTAPTRTAAAKTAGIGESTLRMYMKDPEFVEAYRAAVDAQLAEATDYSRQLLTPALEALRDILQDPGATAGARVNAARTVLEYSARLIDTNDLARRLEDIKRGRGQ
jgi:hypothetical protein